MAYIKLELLHEIFFMQWCSCCVAVHWMVPVLLRRRQNLHPHRLQKGNPHSLLVVLLMLLVTCTMGAELLAVAPMFVSDFDMLGSKKSVMCCS